MVAKAGTTTPSKVRDITYDGHKFTAGSTKGMSAVLSSDSLSGKGGSSPQGGACTIVDEMNTTYRLRDHVDVENVKKAVSKSSVQKALTSAKSAQEVLELLELIGLMLLADYNHLNSNKFVKGHLLPQSLGGAGEEWNLTPMNRSANANWSSHFEKDVVSILKDLQAFEKKKANKDKWGDKFRVLIDYSVKLQGKVTPWFSNPTQATTDMLKQLPAKAVGETSYNCVVDKAGKEIKLSTNDKKDIPNVKAKLTLTL